jgi:hypothetical protein
MRRREFISERRLSREYRLKDARRRPAYSASFRRRQSTTRTFMTMRTCPTCSASPGRVSRSTAARCLSGVPWLHSAAVRLRCALVRPDPAGNAGDRGTHRCDAHRDRPPRSVHAEAGSRCPGRRACRGSGGRTGTGKSSMPRGWLVLAEQMEWIDRQKSTVHDKEK